MAMISAELARALSGRALSLSVNTATPPNRLPRRDLSPRVENGRSPPVLAG